MAQNSAEAYPPVERHPETGISVLVIGAGVGGLCAALECWRKGHKVRIVDRTSKPDTGGDFFSISPAATKAFRHWPEMNAKHLAAARQPYNANYLLTGEQTRKHMPFMVDTTDENGKAVTTVLTQYRHSRPKLHGILIEQLAAVGIEVEFNHKAIKYEETADKGIVRFEDGVVLEGDVVIAADGLGTASYELVLGHKLRARSSGYAIYRTAFPAEVVTRDPQLAQHYRLLDIPKSTPIDMWLGHHIQVFTQLTEDIFSWSMVHQDDGKAQETWHSTSHTCEPADAIKHIEDAQGFCPEILKKTMLATPKDKLLDWKIMWRDSQPNWVSPQGRVIQLGDAAHTFVPSSGNGANQAMEDATSLASCLQLAGKDDIPLALRVHNLLRFERVSCTQITGFQAQVNRNNVDINALTANPDQVVGKWGRWIWAHDPEQYAYDNYEKAKAHLVSGAPFENTNIPAGYKFKPWNIDELLAIGDSGKQIVFEGDWS